ncbi:DUF167 domain-containing protein [bacterium]|nr:DUF167 domain-containing protein [bacterium]
MLKKFVKQHNPNYLRIKVLPKSAKNEVVDIMDDNTIKIRIKAVPEKGKANKELVKFLSKELDLPKTSVQIISGKTDQIKLIKIV